MGTDDLREGGFRHVEIAGNDDLFIFYLFKYYHKGIDGEIP